MSQLKHYAIHPAWLGRKLTFTVVGAGGTGSMMLGALAQMAVALRELGHPGIKVFAVDDDTVSAANIGRQAFYPPDIGQAKVDVLVNRINQSFGLDFKAIAARLNPDSEERWVTDVVRETDVWVGCVDTRKARKAIQDCYMSKLDQQWSKAPVAWLDCGNLARTGQVVLGLHEGPRISGHGQHARHVALPSVADLFPETVDAAQDATDDAPSCSLAEALRKQDLFTNRMVCDSAANLLWQLLRHGRIDTHGAFINLETMRINPIPVNPVTWKRMGYEWVAPATTPEPEAQAA